MRRNLAILTVAFFIVATGSALGQTQKDKDKVHIGTAARYDAPIVYKVTNKWIQRWTKIDQSIYSSIPIASKIFGVSESLLLDINRGEGGNINPTTLSYSLCTGRDGQGSGWNLQGSYAFGPFQFMLHSKPACYDHEQWGTFACCDYAAFADAKRRGISIPYRFKNPASNIGQAIVAAYMIANGGLHHWGR